MNKDLCNWISRGGKSTTHTLGNILIKDIIDISSITYENCAICIDGKIEYIIEKHKFIPDRKQFSTQEGFYTVIDLGVKYSNIYTYHIYEQTLSMKKEERECDNNA